MKLPVNTIEFWKERIAQSKNYGDIHHSVYISSSTLWKNIEKAHREILAREVGPSDKVLDAGCGYGRCMEWFLPHQYVGVDLSPDFIELARKNHPHGDFYQSDLSKLPLGDKAVDVAFCISIKQMVIGNLGEEAWKPIEMELVRVAKKVLILEYENPDKYTILG